MFEDLFRALKRRRELKAMPEMVIGAEDIVVVKTTPTINEPHLHDYRMIQLANPEGYSVWDCACGSRLRRYNTLPGQSERVEEVTNNMGSINNVLNVPGPQARSLADLVAS